MDKEACHNTFCSGPEKCLLNEAINAPVSLNDLFDHWFLLFENCPNVKSLKSIFQKKATELEVQERINCKS